MSDIGDNDSASRNGHHGAGNRHCQVFSLQHAVGLGAYFMAGALMFTHIFFLRQHAVVQKRGRCAVFLFAVYCHLGGTVALIGVLCGENESSLHIVLEAIFEYINLGTIAFLYLFRMLIFVETEIRNQSGLMRLNARSPSAKFQNYTASERKVFELLGFQNIAEAKNSTIGGKSMSRTRFLPSKLIRAFLINVMIYAIVCVIVTSILGLSVNFDIQKMAENINYFWLGMVLVSLPYQIFISKFIYRIAWIKDGYWIRLEFITQSAILQLCSLIIDVCIILNPKITQPFGVNTYMLVAFVAIALVQLTQYVTIILPDAISSLKSRWHRNSAPDVSAMTFGDFEVQLGDMDFLAELKPQLAAEFCIENALFIEDFDDCINRHRSIIQRATTSESDEYEAANSLFEKFIRRRASNELNLPHTITQHLLKKRRLHTLRLSDFDAVRRHIAKSIFENSYAKYVERRSAMQLSSNTASSFL